MVVYDITDRDSFVSVETWIDEIKKFGQNCTPILVGNKTDLAGSRREVAPEEGQAMADSYNVKFVETSAKDFNNVKQAFEDMTREIY